jgi:hypothetical protein
MDVFRSKLLTETCLSTGFLVMGLHVTLCSEQYTHSTCALFVTRTISSRHSGHSHMRYRMSVPTVAVVAWILFHCLNHQPAGGDSVWRGLSKQSWMFSFNDVSEQRVTRRHHWAHWYVTGTDMAKRSEVSCTRKVLGVRWCLKKISQTYARPLPALHVSRHKLHPAVYWALRKCLLLHAYKLQVSLEMRRYSN